MLRRRIARPANQILCRYKSGTTSDADSLPDVPAPRSSNQSRVRSYNNEYQLIQGEKGLFHKEIPFGNWRAASYVSFWPVVPYVPEGYDDKRTMRSEISGESYHVGTTDYAVTRIAECGGLDSYILESTEEELDSQFGIDLKRLLLQIVESDKIISEPITTTDALKHSLKLEAILGFKLSTTDSLTADVLDEKGMLEDSELPMDTDNWFDE